MTRLGDTACRTLAAVLTLHARNGRVTVRDVAAEVGFDAGWTHENLVRLRSEGLVTWEDNRTATIRPTCTVVPPDEHLSGATIRGRGRGVALTTPGRGQPPETPRGANMAERYPRSPSHARGQA